MYRALKPVLNANAEVVGYEGGCPVCLAAIRLDPLRNVTARCAHLKRTWMVTADRRMRAEYQTPAEAAC